MKKFAAWALVAMVSTAAQAAIEVGGVSADSVSAGNNPELLLVIWDPTNKISYTRDLGVFAYSNNYALGDTSTNLFVYGQQDAGYQKLYAPLNTDPNFQTFLATSSDVTKQVWAIVGVAIDSDLPLTEKGTFLFSTARHDAPTGTVDGDYTSLTTWQGSEMVNAAGSLSSTTIPNINNTCTTSASCVTNYAENLSHTFTKTANPLQYADAAFSSSGKLLGSTQGPSIFNPVNHSSWFYATTLQSDVGDDVVTIDEFDNLAHDAYWGLGVDGSGNYILSYTMEAAMTQPLTAAGSLLRLKTDYAASYGRTRRIDVPAGEIFTPGTVTAVPEPATWGLMGLGLAVLAVRARRRA